jgi:hypothetical protein
MKNEHHFSKKPEMDVQEYHEYFNKLRRKLGGKTQK